MVFQELHIVLFGEHRLHGVLRASHMCSSGSVMCAPLQELHTCVVLRASSVRRSGSVICVVLGASYMRRSGSVMYALF